MTIKSIFNIIGRNLKIYSNSKFSSLIIILGPLILIMVLGASLQDASLKNIKAGIFSAESGEFKDNFVGLLETKSFMVTMEDSLEGCKKSVIDEENHVCINLKKNTELKDISSNYGNYDVDMYVDFSKQRIVWGIIGAIQGVVEQESYSEREGIINDIKSRTGNLNSRLTDVEEGLVNALSIADSIKQKNVNARSSLDNLRTSVSNAEQSMIEIRSSGALGQPYYSILSSAIDNLNSSETDINNLEGNLIAEIEIAKIENNIRDSLDSVSVLRQDIDKLNNVNAERLANPIVLTYYAASDNQEGGSIQNKLGTLDYLFPSFLIFFLLFDSLIFSAVIIVKERSSNAYIRNVTSKNRGITFIAGNMLTILLLVIIQMGIIIFAAHFFLNIDILPNIYSIIPVILIAAVIFSLLGVLMGYLFSSYESGVFASISLSLLLLIFSSIITPAEILPPILSSIVKFSPLALLETKLRTILIFNTPFILDLGEIISLASVAVISSILIGFFYKKSKEKEI
jgi:ABC-type polysaccharide/polyol phosphate export permease